MKKKILCGVLFLLSNRTFAFNLDFYTKSTEIDNSHFQVEIVKEVPRIDQSVCPNDLVLDHSAGTRCEKSGFKYYDVVRTSEKSSLVYCLKQNLKRALNIQFKANNLVVEDTKNKPNTSLVKNDLVISVADQNVSDVGQIKKVIYDHPNLKSVRMKIKRSDKEMIIDEPIIDVPDLALKVSDIWTIHSKCLSNVPMAERTKSDK